jgi:tetratricopeptide (TPR) repeat protein
MFSRGRPAVMLAGMNAPRPATRSADPAKIAGRNDPCPCGSGRKYKHCCGGKHPAGGGGPAPSTGTLTGAGEFLNEFSPLRQAMRQGPGRAGGGAQAAQELLNLAARHEAAHRREQALAALRQAVSLAPDNATAHYNLGLTCFKAGRLPDAIASLRRAVVLQPGFGLAQFRLGVALQHQGLEDEAIEALRAAVALGTRVREAYARLGDLLWSRDMVAAADCYRLAVDSSTKGRLNAAKALMAEEKFDAAVATLRRALALDPWNLEVEWLLGSVLVFQGELAEAVRLFEHVVEQAPEAANAYHSLALARRITEADRPLVARMAEVLRTAVLSDTDHMKLEYALGKACDDLKDYAAAMHHFDAANQIDKGTTGYDRTQQTERVDRLIERYTPEYFVRHAALGVADEAPVFVLGMPRSGTTLVEQIVSSHPLVAGGGEREYWVRNGAAGEEGAADGPAEAVIQRLAADYLAELRRVAPHAARVTDKLPYNFLWIGLIHLALPNARIVHCRRHPVDTCLSIYFAHFARRANFGSDRGDLACEYRQYERLMAHWRAMLPADRFLDVDYETLVADQEAGTRRLIEFCGLEWDDACLRPEGNRRVVMTASSWQARQPVYRSSVARWRNYEPWLGELRELLPPEDRA